MQVNRHLVDKEMDRIDHALGRPVDPTSAGYRNNYAVFDGAPEIAMFEASEHWRLVSRQGDMRFYQVTEQGRKALALHLRETGDKHKLFWVTFEDQQSKVVGTSHSNARYRHWLNISDCLPDMKYSDFMRRATVRTA